tara:strand:+ start:71 stop:805 length:735 start_codon:yes stop_codon:yes gene_type:complete
MGVQIQGDTGNVIATKGTYSGNVTVGGTLTYEDVTNIDSVGLVTARQGIEVGASPGVAASISVDGNMIMSGISTFGGKVLPSSDSSIDIGTTSVRFQNAYVDNYYGSGANLTSLPSAQLTGALPAISGANLTGIEAGIQTSNAATMSGITTVLDLSKDDFKITASGITTVDVRGGSEGNSHTIRIHNSGITTVGFSTYFLFPSGAAPIIPTSDGTISLISFTVDRQGAVGLATQLLAGSSVNFS